MTASVHSNSHLESLAPAVAQWVEEVRALTQPSTVVWCDGSQAEQARLRHELSARGELHALNPTTFPDCYLYRSDPRDVARVEHLTFICTRVAADAGPNNNWMDPAESQAKMRALFNGCMRGRTLYVVPYRMGPGGSPYARCGVEITDSAYVALSMSIMTHVGADALRAMASGRFVRGLHSTGDLDPTRRFIMHYPEELLIQSFGSGYGGNALLGKKCHALRIASWQARTEGWLAEHMLIVGLTNPKGVTHYVAAAFPSACGKTNLAMLVPPASLPGWKVETVGDDIAWLHAGPDGRLWAVNPEAGYFGVVPGTNEKTNRNAYDTLRRNTLFTNVALTADNEPWWEGLPTGKPAIDWCGRPYDPKNGPAAHPNARFTVPASQNPAYDPAAGDPAGVPISAILFGGRRRELAPLVYEARDWDHGVMVGALVASETTAAATGEVGVVRRDPMAMKPFCGYHYGDYWQHWLRFGGGIRRPPRIFHVNWFRQDSQGRFLWPGFGDNLRVLAWMLERCDGRVDAEETAIGLMPRSGDLNLAGLDVSTDALRELCAVPRAAWEREAADFEAFLREYGERVPAQLHAQLAQLRARLAAG